MYPGTGVFQDVIQDFVRYFARISEVLCQAFRGKDFRGIVPMFSELFVGFLRTGIFRETHRIISAPFRLEVGP